MRFKGTDAVMSLEGWKLTMTCGRCELDRSKLASDLYASISPKESLNRILPKLKCPCGGIPVRLTAECVWVQGKPFYRTVPLIVDITDLLELDKRKKAA